jgi:release factor glutamine methyltransferase
MYISQWLKQSVDDLQKHDIPTARLDALVLLEDELQHDRSWLLSHPEHVLQGSELKKLNKKIVQRARHTPLAYIRGHAEFYGREFAVNAHTLVPRPETETMLELLKALQPADDTTILDVGTGSGCIAITVALEFPNAIVRGCDIDNNGLEIARQNADTLQATVSFYTDDLLTHAEPCNILLANLPYVPTDFHINTAATHEPKHAIFGGSDGLDLFRHMFGQIQSASWQPQHLFTESLPSSHAAMADIAKAAGYQLVVTDDFIQHFSRV